MGRYRHSTSKLDALINQVAQPQRRAVTREALVAAGVSPHTIDSRLRDGRLIRFARGVYLAAPVIDRNDAEAAAALLTAGEGSALSHLAAARIDGLPIPDRLFTAPRLPIDVTAPGVRRAAGPRVRVHSTALAPSEIKRKGSLRLTRALRTVADLAPRMSTREVEQTVAVCLRRKLFDRAAIGDHVASHRATPGTAAMRRFVLAEPSMTRSAAEELLRSLLFAAGEPPPNMNHWVEGREVDAYWPRERLVVEVQSKQWHSGEGALEDDTEKAALFAALGYVHLPVTATQLTRRPAMVTGRITHALGRLRRAGVASAATSAGPPRSSRPCPLRGQLDPGDGVNDREGRERCEG